MTDTNKQVKAVMKLIRINRNEAFYWRLADNELHRKSSAIFAKAIARIELEKCRNGKET